MEQLSSEVSVSQVHPPETPLLRAALRRPVAAALVVIAGLSVGILWRTAQVGGTTERFAGPQAWLCLGLGVGGMMGAWLLGGRLLVWCGKGRVAPASALRREAWALTPVILSVAYAVNLVFRMRTLMDALLLTIVVGLAATHALAFASVRARPGSRHHMVIIPLGIFLGYAAVWYAGRVDYLLWRLLTGIGLLTTIAYAGRAALVYLNIPRAAAVTVGLIAGATATFVLAHYQRPWDMAEPSYWRSFRVLPPLPNAEGWHGPGATTARINLDGEWRPATILTEAAPVTFALSNAHCATSATPCRRPPMPVWYAGATAGLGGINGHGGRGGHWTARCANSQVTEPVTVQPRMRPRPSSTPAHDTDALTWKRSRITIGNGASACAGDTVEITFTPDAASLPLALGPLPTSMSPLQWQEPRRPNILFILVDTLRADHLSAYGYPRKTSPTMDRLAAEGVLFENAFTQSTWSTAAVASLMTSLYPGQHGSIDMGTMKLHPMHTTLAEALRDAGYQTHAVSGNPLVSVTTLFDQGFQSFDEACFGAVSYGSSACIADRTIRALETLDAERPFFVYTHFFDPHDPYLAPGSLGATLRSSLTLRDPPRFMDRFLHLSYDAEIRYVDDQIARILNALNAQGLAERTIVVITADHGEELGERGYYAHGYTVYESVTHVPLIIHVPPSVDRRAPARRLGALIESIDIMPTLLTLADVAIPSAVSGISYAPLIVSDHDFTPRAFTYSNVIEHTAYRTREWKLVVNTIAKRVELYHIAADPAETHDVAQSEPDMTRALTHALDAHLAEIRKKSKPFPGRPAIEDEMRERLRALGYVH